MGAGPATAERAQASARPWSFLARRPDLAGALLSVALTTVGVVLVMRLWRADLGVPFRLDGDAIFNFAVVKQIIDHGGWFHNPSLGAPFGQDLHDFAMGGDLVHLVALKLLGFLTGDAVVALNAYFLIGIPLTALAAFLVLRWLDVSLGPAVVCSVLFALTPYTFIRGEFHIFLAVAFPVPLAAYLVLAVWRGSPLFGGRWRTLGTLAICVVVGSTGSFYYPLFAVLLLLGAGLLASLEYGRARLATAGVLIAAIGVIAAINLLPTAVYALDHGSNEVVAKRTAAESEVYGLKFAHLVFPVERHRLRPLARLKERYATTTTPRAPAESFSSTLGLVGSIGLLWALLVALVYLAVPGRARGGDQRERRLAASTFIAFLIGTVGGVGVVLAFLVSPQLRAWNRISVFIAFFALAIVALLLDRARRRWTSPRGRTAFAVLLPMTLLVGIFDQTTNVFIPQYDGLKAAWERDRAFVEQIETRLPGEARVLQLPYMRFPESPPVGGVGDYALERLYLHSDRLRWSYGAMKGRPADWQWGLPVDPPVTAAAAAAAGFDGIYIERAGFRDAGRRLETGFGRELGQASLADPTGQLSFFDLSAYRRRLADSHPPRALRALRTATLRPLGVERGDGGHIPQPGGSALAFPVVDNSFRLELHNPGPGSRRASVAVVLRRSGDRPEPVGVRYPDRSTVSVPVARRPVNAEREVVLPPGRSVLELYTNAPPDEDSYFKQRRRYELAVVVTDMAFVPFGAEICKGGQVPRDAVDALADDRFRGTRFALQPRSGCV